MVAKHEELNKKMHEVYERFGRPLEAEHWGDFAAIMEDGRYVLGADSHDVALEASRRFGKGVFLFKVGEIAVGRMRDFRFDSFIR